MARHPANLFCYFHSFFPFSMVSASRKCINSKVLECTYLICRTALFKIIAEIFAWVLTKNFEFILKISQLSCEFKVIFWSQIRSKLWILVHFGNNVCIRSLFFFARVFLHSWSYFDITYLVVYVTPSTRHKTLYFPVMRDECPRHAWKPSVFLHAGTVDS